MILLQLPVDGRIILGVLIGSIIPDADNLANYLGRLLNSQRLFNYRTAAHSFLGLALAAGISILLFPSVISTSIILAYCMHLIADTFYIEGSSLLYPLKKESRSLAPVKLKGVEEFICGVILLLIFISRFV